MANYDSQYSGPQIDTAVGRALNPDTEPTPSSENLISSDAVAAAISAVASTIAAVKGLAQATVISAGTDLNTLLDVGAYSCATSSTAQTLINCPAGVAFAMLTLSRGGSGRVQVLFEGGGNVRVFVRYRNVGPETPFSAWHVIASNPV